MVELMKSENLRREPETTSSPGDEVLVKLEIVEDFLEEELGPLNKRLRGSTSLQQPWSMETNTFPVPPLQYNPLDEPSPLGLRLRKSPSLLDLIQTSLSRGTGSNAKSPQIDNLSSIVKESKAAAAQGAKEKLKASNFAASLLRIGRWEYKSKYEGDLVAKCYFAKHKLVWEVLEGGLKSKIEIQWSDIMALNANCPVDGPGTLTIVLARLPLFFRETNPQPRKHTLWQATTDFTDGQASMHRQHFLQCPQGILDKHFEKLVQCDHRLYHLSQQPEIILDSPYFEPLPSIFEDPEESKDHRFGQLELGNERSTSGSQKSASLATAQPSLFETNKGDVANMISEHVSLEAPSPSSVMDTRAIEGSGVDSRVPRNLDQIRVPGLHSSMSVSDLMNHLERLSEQMNFGQSSGNATECQEILEDIARYLLSDTQLATTSDEKSLMSKVNSLCCLLQKDPILETNSQVKAGICIGGPVHGKDSQLNNPTGMSRKDSFSELLMHLPRVASLPKLLYNLSEEDGITQRR